MKKLYPFLLLFFGLFILFIVGQPIVAGVCILLGIVMIFESIWPEKWLADKDLNYINTPLPTCYNL